MTISSSETFCLNPFIDGNIKPLHLPYGIPRVLQEQSDYCVLQQSAYISGYSRNILMPLWVSYSLNATVRLVLRHQLSLNRHSCFFLWWCIWNMKCTGWYIMLLAIASQRWYEEEQSFYRAHFIIWQKFGHAHESKTSHVVYSVLPKVTVHLKCIPVYLLKVNFVNF